MVSPELRSGCGNSSSPGLTLRAPRRKGRIRPCFLRGAFGCKRPPPFRDRGLRHSFVVVCGDDRGADQAVRDRERSFWAGVPDRLGQLARHVYSRQPALTASDSLGQASTTARRSGVIGADCAPTAPDFAALGLADCRNSLADKPVTESRSTPPVGSTCSEVPARSRRDPGTVVPTCGRLPRCTGRSRGRW
jgi:hypothetical protein